MAVGVTPSILAAPLRWTAMSEVVRVKHCGITSLADAELCVGAGAWALGLNFWRESKRHVRIGEAMEIGAAMKRRVELAGVFVNAPLDDVAQTADQVGLTMIQLHGDEGPAYADEVARRTGAQIIKATRVGDEGDVRALGPFQRADYHLLDTRIDGLPGGTGETFDWRLALRHRGGVPLILAGGLTPDNVADAIETVRPFAVDVAGGTEASPGVKDAARVTAFMEAVASTATPEEVLHESADA
ncbi:MAG: phosphoribosylanthranilate isomerase [Solirubrobacteraceae bacterium]|nr:phosphoribosylanthranilate isomerase [Solirubrobacteraceae bacterium]